MTKGQANGIYQQFGTFVHSDVGCHISHI